MLATFVRGLIVSLTMILAVSATTPPADAAGACLPPSQAPRGLGEFLGLIRSVTGGGIVVNACLQKVGDRYIYRVQVQIGGRVVTRVIDLATGAMQ